MGLEPAFNHYSLGSVGEWLYRFVLGIDQAPGTAGIGRLLLRPHPGGALDRAQGSYQSARGLIQAGWKRAGGQFTYRVQVPPNAQASVHVPSADPASVRDASGRRPAAAGEYSGLHGASEAVFHVGPGHHEFSGPDLRAAT